MRKSACYVDIYQDIYIDNYVDILAALKPFAPSYRDIIVLIRVHDLPKSVSVCADSFDQTFTCKG